MNNRHLISDDRTPPMISHEFIVMKRFVSKSVIVSVVEFVTCLSEPVRISCWCHCSTNDLSSGIAEYAVVLPKSTGLPGRLWLIGAM